MIVLWAYPRVADPFMKLDWAGGCLGFEVRCDATETEGRHFYEREGDVKKDRVSIEIQTLQILIRSIHQTGDLIASSLHRLTSKSRNATRTLDNSKIKSHATEYGIT